MRRKIRVLFFTFLFLAVLIQVSHADIKLKVAVVNPSQTERQTAPVRYDLPKGMTQSDITDIGQMELKYDFDKGNYYLYKSVELKPSEKMIFEIKIRDIWTVPEKEINLLKNHTGSMTGKLRHKKYEKVGGELAKKIIDRLDEISKKEADQNLSIGDHINLYYENLGILGQVKEDIGMLENLVIDVGGIVEDRVQVPVTMAVPMNVSDKGRANTVTLTIKVSNPSAKEKQPANVKYMLPEEVYPRHVIDSDGLGIGYDFNSRSFYLYKDNVPLEPSETKSFTVAIADMWQIPDVDINALKTHTDNLMTLLIGTEYMQDANPIEEKIVKNLNEIKRTQDLKTETDEHVSYYRKNILMLKEAKGFVAQLEKLVTRSGASVGVTIKDAQIQKGGVRKEKKARGYEGVDYLIKSMFKGKVPSVSTTWKIIFVILAFVGILGGLFFWLWYTQVRRAHREDAKMETLQRDQAKKNV